MTRKAITATLLALLTATTACAQLRLGIKAGYNSSLTLRELGRHRPTAQDERAALTQCYDLGLFMRLGARFHVQPELLYGHRSSLYDASLDGQDAQRHITTHVLDVPVMLAYSIVNNRLFRFRAYAGPKLTFRLGSRQHYTGTDGSPLDLVADRLRTLSAGAMLGIGADLLNRITVDCRYNLMSDLKPRTDWTETIRAGYSDPCNGLNISVGILLR